MAKDWFETAYDNAIRTISARGGNPFDFRSQFEKDWDRAQVALAERKIARRTSTDRVFTIVSRQANKLG